MGRKKNEKNRENTMQSIITQNLADIVENEKTKGRNPLYIRSALKEYLQVYMLNFIYTHKEYSKIFLFTGGTCLRHCFGLNRLSEDIDFDLTCDIDPDEIARELITYWKNRFGEENVLVSVRQRGKQILQKFSVLRELGLATTQESPVLYVKTDLSPIQTKIYDTQTTLKHLYGFSYLVNHYDLPSLMAGKIHAVIFRQRFAGREDREVVKGRDFFDLLWFLQNKVKLNLPRVQALMKRKVNELEVWEMVDERVKWAMKLKDSFARDLLPFIENQEIVVDFAETYQKQYTIARTGI